MYLDHTARISGGEIALQRLLGALDRSLVKPLVALGEDGPLTDRIRSSGAEVVVLPLDPSIGDVRKDTLGLGGLRHLRNLARLARYAKAVAELARERRTDIIHTNSLKSDIYGGLAGRYCHVPVVWHVRDHIDPGYLPLPAVRMFRWLARWLPDYVITNSHSTLDRLYLGRSRPWAVVPSGIVPKIIVHDGLDPSGHDEAAPVQPWRSPVNVGIVGRLAPWKGQHVFLEAGARVLKAGHDIQLVVVGAPLFGEEQYAQSLRDLALNLGISGRVVFRGFQEDVQAEIRALDILVHASTSPEPFGQVVIEGMVEGLPVIAADAGGVQEIIAHGENGILTPTGDVPALAAALESLLRNPQQARLLGQAGRRHVLSNFTITQTAEKVMDVYHSVLSHRR